MTQIVQTVLPTVLPVVPVTGKKSVPVAAIVAPVSAAVVLVLLLIGLAFYRSRQRARRASLPAFDFSPPAPAPATRKTGPVQQALVTAVLPPIPTMGYRSDLARAQADAAFAPAEPKPAQEADSTLEKKLPSVIRPPDEPPLAIPSLVLPPPTLDPFADPPTLVLSTSPDGTGPGLSRLSKGSTYDESVAAPSFGHVGYAM